METQAMRPVWALTGEQQLAELDALHADLALLQTRRLHLLAGLDQTGYAKETGATDTIQLIAYRHRLDTTTVRRDVKTANALTKYTLVANALPDPYTAEEGEEDSAVAPEQGQDNAGEGESAGAVRLHVGQAEVIVAALEQIPTRAGVPVEDLLVAEATMVEAPRQLAPKDLRLLGARVRDRLDCDGPEPAEDKAAAREALWLKTADKGVRFGGYLANENAALLQTLIDAGSGPHKTIDGGLDPRSQTKRQADALTDILTAAARSGQAAPAHGGIQPHLTVTIDLDDLKQAGADATGDVTFGEGLSAAAVRRLACDAAVIPVVLGSKSEPVDVGQELRFVSKAMRRALIARDHGCVICKAPPDRCDAHHLTSWVGGGATALSNLRPC